MPATAADIPIELHNLILSFFTTSKLHTREGLRHCVKVKKRELGSISLVCHDWAVVCQPEIFRRIRLRKREDVDTLLHFMTHPMSRIAEYIEKLWCDQYFFQSSAPWIHMIHLQLSPRLRSSPKTSVSLHGPLRPGQRIASVFSSLPRRLPSGILQIQFLSLRNVHFERFRDLVRLVGEIPSLNDVRCVDVTWNSPLGDQLPVPMPSISRDPGYCQYRFKGCTDDAAGLWLHWLLPPNKTCRMRAEDGHALYRIASALGKNIKSTRFDYIARSSRNASIICLYFYAYDLFSTLTAEALAHLTPAGNSRWISSLDLDFAVSHRRSAAEIIAHSDWATIDEQIATLHDLDAVSLCFSAFEDLLLVARDIVALKMPRLSDSSKLTYVVLKGKGKGKLEERRTMYSPETIQLELAKEAEKLRAARGTDGPCAEPIPTGKAVEEVKDSDVVTSGADEGLPIMEVPAGASVEELDEKAFL